jgi:murein L,D-transpeptidase YcbB/YkuD
MQTKSYYLNKGDFLWIDRHGVDNRADSLLDYLSNIGKYGLGKREFYVDAIRRDLIKVRTLDFDNDDINSVMARLEYHLTSAYMRYVTGLKFGFINPYRLFNQTDTLKVDSTGKVIKFRRLFDIPVYLPGKNYFKSSIAKIYNDSVGDYLRTCIPGNPLYKTYLEELNRCERGSERWKIVQCNLERLRWRYKRIPSGRYILVNVSSFKLQMSDNGIVQEMNVGCGTYKTKTPLLTSEIERMDLNPKWILPMSIIEKDIVKHHVGDVSYFNRNHMYVLERSTGKRVAPQHVTASMYLSGNYRVIQDGGEGNALGRIIFRFRNSFSVFLHDTSSRDFFDNSYRGVSHGCVRVEKPLDLALFLLGDKDDDEMADKLRVTMDMPAVSSKWKQLQQAGGNRPLGSLTVSPRVPLYITYFTMFPNADGILQCYPDVYGYDILIDKYIKSFLL